MTEDEINDLSVLIVGDLVLAGLIPDCTDTDDDNEFDFQDTIRETLAKKYGVELEQCNFSEQNRYKAVTKKQTRWL